jgi:hypothetical protein
VVLFTLQKVAIPKRHISRHSKPVKEKSAERDQAIFLRHLAGRSQTSEAMMNSIRHIKKIFLLCMLASPLLPASAHPQTPAAPASSVATASDGQHDFDFVFGTWKVHLSRRQHPLTGSNVWVDSDGTSAVRKVWDGRANLEELEVDGSTGPIEGLTVRLYNPVSHQWNLYWVSSKDGVVGQAMIGEFKNGRGEFFGQDTVNGRTIMVRQVWSNITPTSRHFEQSFSDDGGQTWESNWLATFTRQDQAASKTHSRPVSNEPEQHDFDYNLGKWKEHTTRLVHPLTGSTTWIEMDGVSVFSKLWNGRAQMAELESDGPKGHLELLTLRFYNPAAHQWSLSFATSNVGILGTPATIGEFKNGRGVFYDQELFNDKAIWVRFTIYSITPDSALSEQAFSNDGGKTWETNWINKYKRISDDLDKNR